MAFPRSLGYFAVPMLRARALGCSATAPRAAVLALAAVALGGCPESGDLNEDFTVPTSISVDPAGFLGDVPCSNAAGAMRSYVATVIDRTDPAALFTLPSSPPTPCSTRVQFRFVVPGHLYSAEIDGYEQRADELTPYGGEGSGSRHLLDAAGAPVEPRWTTGYCAEVSARESVTTFVGACDPLEDRGVPGSTVIRVDPSAALGGLRCAADGGDVLSFDVLPEAGGLPPVLGIACPPAAPVVYSAGLASGQTYGFRIEASGFFGHSYGASCRALTREALAVTATCDPLSDVGALTVPIEEVLQGTGLACAPGGAATYVAALPGALETLPLPCTQRAHFNLLEPGSYEITVEVRGADGAPLATVPCTGDVIPGASTLATCTPAL